MLDTHDRPTQHNAIAAAIAAFLGAMAELFSSSRNDVALAALKRADDERNEASEAAIKSKYAGAWYKRDEIRRRAAAHGVAFMLSASYEHQAAILDFLDDPHRPTPLTWGHTTWFYAVDGDGQLTASRTHPVNRAKYIWNVIDLHGQPATGITSIDEAIARLKETFPADRLTWTASQWRKFEDGRAGNKPTATPLPTALRPADNGVATPLNDVPNRL